jgi:SAM-dependent methyltransferase
VREGVRSEIAVLGEAGHRSSLSGGTDSLLKPDSTRRGTNWAAQGQRLPTCEIGARYLPTPQHVVDAMLVLAEVSSHDRVYDPGCGDGRFVITAAQRYGAVGVGVDVDRWCIEQSRENARRAGVQRLVRFLHEDVRRVDLSPATVVTLYMPARWNAQFLPKLRRELDRGSRIVAYMYDFGGWPAVETQLVTDQYGRKSPIFLWRLGDRTPASPSGQSTIAS